MPSIRDMFTRRPSASAIKEAREAEPDVVAIDDERAEEVFGALSSGTARSILAALYDRPRTASEVAEAVDTSLQNVHYHLTTLQDGNLVEVADTWYSDQGKEMKVYVPTNEALVVFAGDDVDRSSFLDHVKRFLGFVAIFAGLAVAVDRLARRALLETPDQVAGSGMGSGEPTSFVVPPGALFFAGALVALLVVSAWYAARARR